MITKFKLFEKHIHDFFEIFEIVNLTIDRIKGYIETGIDINIQDENGETILFYIVAHGEEKILKYMMNETDIDINIQNNIDETAFSKIHIYDHENYNLFLNNPLFKPSMQDLVNLINEENYGVSKKILKKYIETGGDWKQKINGKYFFETKNDDDEIRYFIGDYKEILDFYEKWKKAKEFNL